MRCLINLCWPKNSKINERKIVMLEALTKYVSLDGGIMTFISFIFSWVFFFFNIKTSHPGVVTHPRDLSFWEEVGREFKASGGYQRYCPSKQQNHRGPCNTLADFQTSVKRSQSGWALSRTGMRVLAPRPSVISGFHILGAFSSGSLQYQPLSETRRGYKTGLD